MSRRLVRRVLNVPGVMNVPGMMIHLLVFHRGVVTGVVTLVPEGGEGKQVRRAFKMRNELCVCFTTGLKRTPHTCVNEGGCGVNRGERGGVLCELFVCASRPPP